MVEKNLLLVLKSSVFGDSEPDLGAKLMQAFLGQLLEQNEVPAEIICMNSGIFLTTTEGSPEVELMRQFAAAGTRVYSCGTCLEYFERTDKLTVGEVGNMADTVRAVASYKKVLQI